MAKKYVTRVKKQLHPEPPPLKAVSQAELRFQANEPQDQTDLHQGGHIYYL